MRAAAIVDPRLSDEIIEPRNLIIFALQPDRLEKVPHYWGAQSVYWGVLRP